ncbi:MAG: TonB family protein [Prevotella sp.]|nr:TonB family protein [Prevotella sp.]
MAKIDLVSNEWTDLIFQGKNQAYGAYKLRKGTSKRNVMSIVIMAIAAALAFAVIALKNAYEASQKAKFEQVVEATTIKEVKKKAEVKRKAPVKVEQEQKVEKVKSSIKFTAPVIKKDSEVKPEEEMKSQEDLNKTSTSIGAFDVKGNDEAAGVVLQAKQDIAQPEPPKHEEVENKVFTTVEQMPSFPGGDAALMNWLRKNVRYPAVAEENGIQGRVVVSFVVERNGSITDVQVVKSVDPSLDKEASRVVKSMPNWIPGKQNGSAVRVKYNVPVTFRLAQ